MTRRQTNPGFAHVEPGLVFGCCHISGQDVVRRVRPRREALDTSGSSLPAPAGQRHNRFRKKLTRAAGRGRLFSVEQCVPTVRFSR